MLRRPEQLPGVLAVTPSFFTTLRRRTGKRGRAFSEADAEPGADRFAILTPPRRRFGGDSSVIGREIRLSGEPYQVVGVLPSDFELPARDIAILVPYRSRRCSARTPIEGTKAAR